MSTVYSNKHCFLLDHQHYINVLFSSVKVSNEAKVFQIDPRLFSIKRVSKSGLIRKRKLGCDAELLETKLVKSLYESLQEGIPENLKLGFKKLNISDTCTVRDLAKKYLEKTSLVTSGLNGGNNSDNSILCTIKGHSFLLPPNSRFFCGCVKEQLPKLIGNKYNLLIADPPWWNKFIRRLKSANDTLSYSMMYNEDIAQIPVKELLSPNTLVAVWCTNSPSNTEAVKTQIFPQWGVQYVATWFWLKVTTDFEPLCDFGVGCQKQPYERIILGKTGEIKDMPAEKLVVSIPSALHSHKPPLLDILSPYLNEEPKTLELFARYLLPGTTSVGYEPLKWQNLSLYQAVNS